MSTSFRVIPRSVWLTQGLWGEDGGSVDAGLEMYLEIYRRGKRGICKQTSHDKAGWRFLSVCRPVGWR